MSILGARIKEVRSKRSQAEFASLLNVDRTTVGSWELGRHEPDVETLLKIASIANVSIDWLTGHSKFHSLADEKLYYDDKWHEVIDIANRRNLSPKQVKDLLIAGLALHSSD